MEELSNVWHNTVASIKRNSFVESGMKTVSAHKEKLIPIAFATAVITGSAIIAWRRKTERPPVKQSTSDVVIEVLELPPEV
jgi:hypothetical protein